MSRRSVDPPFRSRNPQAPTIPLTAWAASLYPEKPPSKFTLRRWVREQKIIPQPVKVGREYRVRLDAVYVNYNDAESIQAATDRFQRELEAEGNA